MRAESMNRVLLSSKFTMQLICIHMLYVNIIVRKNNDSLCSFDKDHFSSQLSMYTKLCVIKVIPKIFYGNCLNACRGAWVGVCSVCLYVRVDNNNITNGRTFVN